MTLGEKIRTLRLQKNITQEQLAERLFVSRTAVSKWERDAGYPNLDSLKLLANEFNVSLDELLSSEEVFAVAKEENKNLRSNLLNLLFGVVDILSLLLIFLPLYGQKEGDFIKAVSLINLVSSPVFIALYYTNVALIFICGVAELILYFTKRNNVGKIINYVSLSVASFAVVLFTSTLKPYAAVTAFIMLIIKVLILFKIRSTK